MNNLYLTTDKDCLLFNDEIMVYTYVAGDCDAIKNKPDHYYMLSEYLYDAVNTGELPNNTNVYLPDGQLFGHSYGYHFIDDMEYDIPEEVSMAGFWY